MNASRRWSLAIPVAVLLALNSTTAIAATTDPDPTPLELQNAQLSRSAAAQGMVLLENHDHALPIAARSTVALFGVGAYATVKGGTGSGNVNNRYTINARTGLENAGYTVTTSDAYWSAMTSAYDTKYPSSATGAVFGPAVDYASVEQPLSPASVQPTKPTDTAIFVVARNSGEGADRSAGAGDYQLTTTESADLAAIGHAYRHVVIALNVGGIIDTSFFPQVNGTTKDPAGGQALDALLDLGQAGQESGNALADVLSGKVNPSGKLSDTWASKYSYYPASATFGANDGNTTTEDYSEGVYVGYRYFDSFDKKLGPAAVAYPFGYGLSYTDFAITPESVKADAKTVTVKAKVKNTGSRYSGKQVVQVYFSAPQTGLDKPYQQLAGYAKTDTLKPGASQVVTVQYKTTDMASYDSRTASYVLDSGKYAIRVGDSSRTTQVAARLDLDRKVTTEVVNHEMNDAQPATELTSDPANFYTYPAEKRQLATAPVVALKSGSFRTLNRKSALEQNVSVPTTSPYYAIDGGKISSTTAYVSQSGSAYQPRTGETVKKVSVDPKATLYDVAEGKISLTRFVAGLSDTQLADIVEGASAGGTVPQAAGAAGYTTSKYESLGIPALVLSDGPAGLRLTQKVNSTPPTYQYQTAWPIGTQLAQTWDRDLVRKVGHAIGLEMKAAHVTLWLAPGMNIHRDPLNGRNFEYFSEDPLVSGLTSAAETLGVQSNPGVGVTVKHFVANNQEANRNAVDELIGERALREIYLRGFQISVETARPMAVMSSYNQVNGSYSSANYDLLTDLLRGEWGFQGLVMSDWGGSHNPVATMYSGNDLIEPGNKPGEILANLKKVTPVLDVTGLPVLVTSTSAASGRTSNTWSLGGFTLDAAGTETISTTVDAQTNLAKVLSTVTTVDASGVATTKARGPYASVADAYADVQSLLGGTALTAAQKAAITLTPTGTPVTGYTITLKGHYNEPYSMRLGDLQRSTSRILTVIMHSQPFQDLAKSR